MEFTASDLVVTLADGRKIATPLDWYPRLKRASAAQRANYEIMPMGIHWPDIDEDLSVAGVDARSASGWGWRGSSHSLTVAYLIFGLSRVTSRPPPQPLPTRGRGS